MDYQVSLSTKSWHYRLQKFVFRNDMPRLYNLCPYFWLTMLCIIITFIIPIIPIVRGIGLLGRFIGNKMESILYHNWVKNLLPGTLRSMHQGHAQWDRPNYVWNYMSKKNADPFKDWLKLHKLDISTPDGEEKFLKILEQMFTIEGVKADKKYRNDAIARQKSKEAKNKRRDRIEKAINSVTALADMWAGFWTRVARNYPALIKMTKKFVGGIFTIFLMVFFAWVMYNFIIFVAWIVSLISLALVLTVLWWVVVVSLTIFLFVLIVIFIEDLSERIKKADKTVWNAIWNWIITPLNYILVIPIVFLFKIIRTISQYLWVWFVEGIMLIGRLIVFIGKVIFVDLFGNFFKLFREYFGGAYGDFCPGVKWDDEKSQPDVGPNQDISGISGWQTESMDQEPNK